MLNIILKGIEEPRKDIMEEAKNKLDSLAKPIGSLGVLEEIVIKLAGITGKVKNTIKNKCIIIMCADNGVVDEGIALAPQSVTLAQTKNFIKGTNGVASISKENDTKLIVVDIGINSDEKIDKVINRKIAMGTKNLYKENAMTYQEAIKAIEIGIEMVKKAKDDDFEIIGVGEMGIGNTTTSTTVLSCLTSCNVDDIIGKGGGITKEGFKRKKEVIKSAIDNKNIDKSDPLDILSKVGGYDIAGMTGVFIGAAYYKIPVVIDGFISAVAALIAYKLNPIVKNYFFPSHKSEEPGYNLAIKQLGLEPILNLKMRLGEGSGCPIAFSIINFANSMINNMKTFKENGIDDSYIKKLNNK